MASDNPFSADLSSMMSAWMKMASDNWGQTQQPWTSLFSAGKDDSKKSSRTQNSLDSLLKTWRMVSSTMGKPENLQANLSGISELPSVMLQLARISMEGMNRFHERVMNKVSQTPGKPGWFSMDGPDERFFDEWKTLYETEIRKYFNIPQLGLMRFHQEKFNQTIDKYNILQTAMSEFIFVLSKPFEESLKKLQDEMLEQSEKNEWSADPKETYNRWIAILEADFTELMKSPEYLKALGNVLSAQADFTGARDEVIQEMASNLPFASRNEMDELYKDLYRLRKRVRELEKAKRS